MKSIIHSILLSGLILLSCHQIKAQNKAIEGNWEGTLAINSITLKVILHIQKNIDKTYKGTFDSPDQGAYGIAFTSVVFNTPKLTCSLPKMQLKVEGILNPSDSLKLVWQQGPATFPLTMSRSVGEKKIVRPQEPIGELPYESLEVSFKNVKQNLTIFGTLTIPKGKGPFPAVVLISGSGPQDRNSEIFGHKPFLVLSDYLTKQGIAVLRYDDRGTGKSEGVFKSATSLDFAEDAEYAFKFLTDQKRINTSKVGLLGHSEGGMIAPMISAKNKNVAFEILVAGPAIPIDSLMYEQLEMTLKAAGTPDAAIKAQLKFNHRLFNYLKSKPDYATANAGLDSFIKVTLITEIDHDTTGYSKTLKEQQQMLHAIVTPWFHYFINYVPDKNLSKIMSPVLGIYGGKDVQVAAISNAIALQTILSRSGIGGFKVHTFPDLNHLMQHAGTGAVTEYGQIEETFAPEVMEMITTWILALK